VVANLENNQRDDDYHNDGPEAEKLSGQEIGILVGQHDKVVALDIQEGQYKESPAIFYNHLTPFGKAILVDGEGGVYDVQQNIVEEGLESRNTRASSINQRCEGVCSSLSQSNDLGEQEHYPEVPCSQVCKSLVLLRAFSFSGLVYDLSVIDELGSAVNSAIDARARRGGFRRGGGALCLYGDTLYWSLDLVDIVGLVGVALLPIAVAHADGAQHLTRLTKGGGWIAQVTERGKRAWSPNVQSGSSRSTARLEAKQLSSDGFFFCFAEPEPES
jgi:hypothetical protein